MFTFSNTQAASKNSIPFKGYCRNGERKSLFNKFSKRLRHVNNLPLMFFLPKFDFQVIDLAI